MYRKLWKETMQLISGGSYDVLVVDEFMAAYNYGLIPQEEALCFLKEKPEGLEVVLTGGIRIRVLWSWQITCRKSARSDILLTGAFRPGKGSNIRIRYSISENNGRRAGSCTNAGSGIFERSVI